MSPAQPGAVGPLLANTECRLVDPEDGRADGERGELWIRGPQVMKGYLNNDEATAETIDAEGWLPQGTSCRRRGRFFEIVDRLKELIKYKGFQVPPAELEALLLTHPAVADVAVIGVPDEEAASCRRRTSCRPDAATPEELMECVAEHVSPQKRSGCSRWSTRSRSRPRARSCAGY